MKIFVRVKPNSKTESVKRINADHFEVCTKAPPREGKANSAAMRNLAQYLGVPKSRINILAGAKSRQKVFFVSKS